MWIHLFPFAGALVQAVQTVAELAKLDDGGRRRRRRRRRRRPQPR
jgi:hypothetical protein